MPAPMYPGSLASPSAMAYLMSQKYSEGLPLYRQEKQLERMGIYLSHQTMANWMMYGANTWLTYLYDHMHRKLLQQDILHGDETTLQVLNEPGRTATSKSFMWLYRTGQYVPTIVQESFQLDPFSSHLSIAEPLSQQCETLYHRVRMFEPSIADNCSTNSEIERKTTSDYSGGCFPFVYKSK